jgi:uncharacterized protein (UPF0248 family)
VFLEIILILRDFLNRLLWDDRYKGQREDYDIIYTHRGAPRDQLKINCTEVACVNPDSFEYYDEFLDVKKRIPFHRIEQIYNHTKKESIYKKALRR